MRRARENVHCELDDKCQIVSVGERRYITTLLVLRFGSLINKAYHLGKLFFVEKLGVATMILQEAHDLGESQNLNLLFIFKAGKYALVVCFVASVLIFRKYITPELLVLAHEFQDSLMISILFIFYFYILDWLRSHLTNILIGSCSLHKIRNLGWCSICDT